MDKTNNVPAEASPSFLTRGKMVTVGRYPNSMEAAMHAARLTGEGIANELFNSNVNSLGIPYAGLSDVELQVFEDDAAAAKIILSANEDDLEPVAETPDAPPKLDDDGSPLALATVGAFDNVRAMRDAQAVLAAANLRSFPPRLTARGDHPRGEGKRFVLQVMDDDLYRAQTLLSDAQAEVENDGDPRCPKCRSWRTFPVPRFFRIVLAIFGIGKFPPEQVECLACHYRGAPAEFEGRR